MTLNLHTNIYTRFLPAPDLQYEKSDGGVTCHGGGCVTHGRHVGVSWWAHQRGNALSRVHVHVSCGTAEKRAMTNCGISLPTCKTHLCFHRTQTALMFTHSQKNPTDGFPTGDGMVLQATQSVGIWRFGDETQQPLLFLQKCLLYLRH